MRGFLVAGIAQDHPIPIEGVQITFLSLVPGHRMHQSDFIRHAPFF
jgi:hypothetical protein